MPPVGRVSLPFLALNALLPSRMPTAISAVVLSASLVVVGIYSQQINLQLSPESKIFPRHQSVAMYVLPSTLLWKSGVPMVSPDAL